MIRARLTYANVVATLALVLAVGGASAFAAAHLGKNSVGTKQLKNNAVTAAKIKNGAVTGAKIKAGAVSGDKINLGTLGTVPSANHANSADSANSLGGIGPSGFSRAVASGIDDNALQGVSGVAREAKINAPQNGFVLAVASSDVFGSAEDFYNCFLQVDGTEIKNSRRTAEIGAGTNEEENCETNALVPVTAGAHTVQFTYSSVGASTTVDETELDLVFVPLAG